MAGFFKGPNGAGGPPSGGGQSGGGQIAKIGSTSDALARAKAAAGTAVTRAGASVPSNTSTAASGGGTADTLARMARVREEADAYKARPFLVYIILDLTASRSSTRAAMRSYEEKLAKLVMQSGGRHPVLCKGVFFRGDTCSAPVELKDEAAVKRFLDTDPVGGGTCIQPALMHYDSDPVDAVLSLAILIGDSDDGDISGTLIALAEKLGAENRPRPVVVAHEYTSDADFCQIVAPALAKASGGFAFGLSENPTELIALLEGYKAILTATPDELRRAAQSDFRKAGGSSFFRDGMSGAGIEFLKRQGQRMNVPLLAGSAQPGSLPRLTGPQS